MSYKIQKIHSLAGQDFSKLDDAELTALFQQVLENGLHGLCYSAYADGQEPGDHLEEDQIRRRMQIIAPYTSWVRSFSCIEGNELIPKIAHEFGLKTMVGAWLGTDHSKNEEEIAGLIQLANEGLVDIAAVGNEVLYRNDLSSAELLQYLQKTKQALPDVTIGYVDAYYEFTQHPEITNACDVVLANCYPFWEGCHYDYSLLYMKQMYQQALAASNGKKVIITETGWPNHGTNCKDALPSRANAMKYFINAQNWSKQDNIEMFYFTSFDESWKVGNEGDVGAHWGIWDKEEKRKFQ